MAVRTATEIVEAINALLPDSNDDVLSLIEDVTDTVNNNDVQEWQRRYSENDQMWRDRYRERFLSGGAEPPVTDPEPPDTEPEQPKIKSYDELFKEG